MVSMGLHSALHECILITFTVINVFFNFGGTNFFSEDRTECLILYAKLRAHLT